MSKSSLSTSSYLRYIHKFRNQNATTDSNDTLLNKENINDVTASSQNTSISVYEKAKHYKRPSNENKELTNVLQDKTHNYQFENNIKRQEFIYEEPDKYEQLMKRMEKQEESQKDLMRVVKLLQAYNESQDDENNNFREQIRNLQQKIKEMEFRNKGGAEFQEHIQQIKNELIVDIKSVGKELAIDIVQLNKKIDTKTQGNNSKMLEFEKQIEKINQNVYKVLKKYNKMHHFIQKKDSNIIIEKTKKQLEDKNNELNKSFETLQKKIQVLSKDVYQNQRQRKSSTFITSSEKKKDSKLTTIAQSQQSSNQFNSKSNEAFMRQFSKQTSGHVTNDSDYFNKQNEIMQRIMTLERDLNKFKHQDIVNVPPQRNHNSRDPYMSQHHQISQSFDYGQNQSPNFSLGRKISEDRHRDLSNSAARLRHSLEKRVSDNNSELRSCYMPRKNILRGVMDISFSSQSSGGKYYDTGKSMQNKTTIQESTNKRRKSSMKKRSNSRKSVGRKSYDDIMALVNKSDTKKIQSGRKSQPKCNLRQPKQIQHKDNLLNEYLRKKEDVMKDRAQRLIELGNLNISTQISKNSKLKSRQTSIRKSQNSRRSMQSSRRTGRVTLNAKGAVCKTFETPTLQNTMKLNQNIKIKEFFDKQTL